MFLLELFYGGPVPSRAGEEENVANRSDDTTWVWVDDVVELGQAENITTTSSRSSSGDVPAEPLVLV